MRTCVRRAPAHQTSNLATPRRASPLNARAPFAARAPLVDRAATIACLACVACVACAGCTSTVSPPKNPSGAECIVDDDCVAGAGARCVDGTCAAGIPVGEGEGAPSEGEGASSGEGEGAASGEGEGASGEGEGASSGEGEGEGAGGPQTLFVSAGPEQVDALPGCQCNADAPASNVDIRYTSSTGQSCAKPADQSCGVDGGRCACALAGTDWFAARQEDPRANETWIIDEGVDDDGSADGTFTVNASVINDCLLSPADTSASVNQACFDLDCQGSFGGPPACFDYTQLGASCGQASSVAATEATNDDCMVRGPVPVRVHVEARGGAAFTREFCVTMNNGDNVDAVVLRRTNGAYLVSNVSARMHEVTPGAPCP